MNIETIWKSVKVVFMSLVAVCLTTLIILSLVSGSLIAPSGKEADKWLIRNATIVDVEAGALLRDRAIYVEDGVIQSVAPSGTHQEVEDAEIIDASGRYIMPGLWDMHAHASFQTLEQLFLPAMVANGVLYAREMNGDCYGDGCQFARTISESSGLKQQIEGGQVLGPNLMSIGSFSIQSPYKEYQAPEEFMEPASEEDVIKLVALLKERGVGFIKTYDRMPKDVYLLLAKHAGAAGLTLEGHIPKSVSLMEAIEAGHRTVEHARYPLISCSTAARDFHDTYNEFASGDFDVKASAALWYPKFLEAEDSAACEAVMEAWANSETYYVPTHITREAEAIVHNRPYENDPRADYVSDLAIEMAWEEEAEGYGKSFAKNPEREKQYIAIYERGLELTGRAHAAGVKIMTGTDVGDMMVYPGFSLHDEMDRLVQAGLSPLDVLRAATIVPAGFYKADHMYGSIAVGKKADFIILNANPLADIANTKTIKALLYQGRYYDRAAIDNILAEVKFRASGLGLYLYAGWKILMSFV